MSLANMVVSTRAKEVTSLANSVVNAVTKVAMSLANIVISTVAKVVTSLAVTMNNIVAKMPVSRVQTPYLLVHSIQLSGDVPGNQSGQHGGKVCLLHEQILQGRPLPVQVAGGCGCYYGNLSHIKDLRKFSLCKK
jgi:hypothetical protein